MQKRIHLKRALCPLPCFNTCLNAIQKLFIRSKNMGKNKLNQADTLAFIQSEQKADQTVIPTLIPSKTNQAAVDSLQLDCVFVQLSFTCQKGKDILPPSNTVLFLIDSRVIDTRVSKCFLAFHTCSTLATMDIRALIAAPRLAIINP